MQLPDRSSLKLFLLTATIFSSLLLFWQIGCKNNDSTPVQTIANNNGTPTAVGTPTGPPSTTAIGTAGGSLLSADGRSEVIIPSGALNASTQISIQPVTNEAPSGIGDGFSFTPAGQTFNQPVTLRFHYTADDIAGSNIRELAIATQKDDHIWYAFNTLNLDSVAGTVSVLTTHFSLYSLFEKFRIAPETAEIAVNASQALRVATVQKAADNDPNDDLTPLDPMVTYPNGNEVSWTVNGLKIATLDDGDVTPRSGSSTATYTAPPTIDDMSSNPAAVTAEVNIPGSSKFYLISNITVLGGDKSYDVTVDLVGTNVPGMNSDYSFSYTDHAAFVVSTYANADSVHVSSITNKDGQISDFVKHNVTCQLTPDNQGNLLDIQSVSGNVLHQSSKPDRMYLLIQSKTTFFAVTEVCQEISKTIAESSVNTSYSAQSGDLNGSSQTINLVTNLTGVAVTMTITPHQ